MEVLLIPKINFIILPGCCQPVIYFVALVDILTRYGVKKRTAQAAKSVKHGVGAEISTVKPEQYARRFIEFVEKFIVE